MTDKKRREGKCKKRPESRSEKTAWTIMRKLSSVAPCFSDGIQEHPSEGYNAWINYLPRFGGNFNAYGKTPLAAARNLYRLVMGSPTNMVVGTPSAIPVYLKRGHAEDNLPMRVKWLAEHSSLWDNSEVEIAKAMKFAGLFAQSTYVKDINVKRILRLAKESKAK